MRSQPEVLSTGVAEIGVEFPGLKCSAGVAEIDEEFPV